jgi:hypothetical protein
MRVQLARTVNRMPFLHISQTTEVEVGVDVCPTVTALASMAQVCPLPVAAQHIFQPFEGTAQFLHSHLLVVASLSVVYRPGQLGGQHTTVGLFLLA